MPEIKSSFIIAKNYRVLKLVRNNYHAMSGFIIAKNYRVLKRLIHVILID